MTKLSIDALEYNVDKADKVLQIKNLGDVVPTRGGIGAQYTAVRTYFSPESTFPLEGLDDVFALNANQGYVFARFLSTRFKYMLKIKLKMRGITTQLNLSPFGLTFQLLTATYVNLSTMSNSVAFSRGIFVD